MASNRNAEVFELPGDLVMPPTTASNNHPGVFELPGDPGTIPPTPIAADRKSGINITSMHPSSTVTGDFQSSH